MKTKIIVIGMYRTFFQESHSPMCHILWENYSHTPVNNDMKWGWFISVQNLNLLLTIEQVSGVCYIGRSEWVNKGEILDTDLVTNYLQIMKCSYYWLWQFSLVTKWAQREKMDCFSFSRAGLKENGWYAVPSKFASSGCPRNFEFDGNWTSSLLDERWNAFKYLQPSQAALDSNALG